MNGSTASASADFPEADGRLLLVSPNWIGDCVMAMPSIQAWRAAHPYHHLSILCRPGVADLWRMHVAPDSVLLYRKGWTTTWESVRELRAMRFDACVIFPNSFRSAWLPWAGRIPNRAGFRGHWRRWLLTDVRPAGEGDHRHQAWEGYRLFHLPRPEQLPPPALAVPEAAVTAAGEWLSGHGAYRWVGLMPGAARGPSKRWPLNSFLALVRRLVDEANVRIAICGGPDDAEACEALAREAGTAGRNLCGKTGVSEWAAILQLCDVVVCNDSGGMHLAAAVGVPVVALFGLTDPERTGPLGARATLLRGSDRGDRSIARQSMAAEKALASITPQTVYDAVMSWILRPDRPLQ